MDQFYITTAIDYPNGSPHMGHAYEKLVTDIYARWYRLFGSRVHFLTGTDENGQKLQKSAEEVGAETLPFVDEQVEKFRKLCDDMNISHDDFIRTTETRHVETAQWFWNVLAAKEMIYFGKYSGLYCYSCEDFYTEKQAENGECPNHGVKLEHVEEEGYFFRLSQAEDWLIDHVEKNETFLWPSGPRKELLSRLRADGLNDISVSRPNKGWGIPVPGNDDHVMYTWFDALINYYAGVKDSGYWPADVHIIGKDIIWFHCVIWPAMLRGVGLELPKQVYVHGMILGEDGRKMSKSLGNGVDPYDVLNTYKLDTFRFYLARHISSGADGRFSLHELSRTNNELADGLGNLLMRGVKLAMKRIGDTVTCDEAKQELNGKALGDLMHQAMTLRNHNKALETLWAFVKNTNQYINDTAPWKIKDDPRRFHEVIYNVLCALHEIGRLLQPFIPDSAEAILEALGAGRDEAQNHGDLTFKLSDPAPLFPKLEVEN